ncbi:MAG: beta strand repeat-containing protein [Luteolibacter sp.]
MSAALGSAQIVTYGINGLSGTTDTVVGTDATGAISSELARTGLTANSGTNVYASTGNYVPQSSPNFSNQYLGFTVAPDADHILFAKSLTFGVSASNTAGNQYAVAISTDGFNTFSSQTGEVTGSAVNQTFDFMDLITNDTLQARIQNYGTVSVGNSTPTSGGSFRLTAGASNTGLQLTGSTVSRATGAINLTANTEIRNSGELALGGNINGEFGVTKTGAGTLILSGSNEYSGNTMITAGTLQAEGTSALGTGSVSITQGSSLLAGPGANVSNNITVDSGTTLAYTQNFDSLGSGLPENWQVYTGATSSSLGNVGTFTSTATSWGTTSGGFYNVASASIGLSSDTSTQAAATNRALGIRQAGTGGLDPGAAVAFSTSTKGEKLSDISLDLMLLNDQTRSTTYAVQYSTNGGTSWTTFTGGTFISDASTGITPFTLSDAFDMEAISDKSALMIRIAALTASTGTGSRDMIGLDNFSISSVLFPTLGSDATSGVSTYSGNVTLDSAVRLTSATGGRVVFSGHISDGANGMQGVTKTGGGVVELNGTNTYTGDTLVSAGMLAVNGSITSNTLVSEGATLMGSGTITGTVIVQSGGTLAPGNSIESLGVGDLIFEEGSIYSYEFQTNLFSTTPEISGDLTYASGTLNIATGTVLTLTDLATSTALAIGTKLTLISYFGGWTSDQLFTYNGEELANNSIFTIGLNQWNFKYDDTSGGLNFTEDQTAATHFVTMTVIPEPTTALLGGLGMLCLLRRRR